MSLHLLYTTHTFFSRIYLGSDYVLFQRNSYGRNKILSVPFYELVGYDFYLHLNKLTRNPALEFEEPTTKSTYPLLLNICHYYSFYGAKKAIE